MPPTLALLIWLILLLALLVFDPAREPGISPAVWVAVIWMFIAGSRLPSQWLSGAEQERSAAEVIESGNSIDRNIFIVLILLAIGILISRSFKWGSFFSRNVALLALLSFALLSVCWSDFPFVALKRWFRDLGNYLVILVVLSDPHPLEAVRTLFRRLGYLLIPLSVVLIKYFPEIGRQYSYWTGAAMYVGATLSKNSLGAVCLVSGLFFFWDLVTRWPDRGRRRTKQIIVLNLAFLAMTLWLLERSDSATSRVCLALGILVILAARTRLVKRQPAFLTTLIPAAFCLYLILAVGFNINGQLAAAVGRDPTLTTRTGIWSFLLSMHTNAFVGTGYESFWLGSRLELIWEKSGFGGINEAHNGYLEMYLNLGLIGLFLLSAFLIASFRTICRRLKPFSSFASLSLALWTVTLFYNVTEAAFKAHLMWLTFLIAALAVPGRAQDHATSISEFEIAGTRAIFQDLPLETKRLEG